VAAWGGEGSVVVLVDRGSVEVFADGGTTVLSNVFYPEKDFDRLEVEAESATFRPFIK